MVNKGMHFRMVLSPFVVNGTVGGKVRLAMATAGAIEIAGRDEIYAFAEKLERLGDEVCQLNGWEGEWNLRLHGEYQAEEANNGVSVQNLVEE